MGGAGGRTTRRKPDARGLQMNNDFLKLLPNTDDFVARARALAMLDAVLSPEWEYRYSSFDAHWFEGQVVASMRDGEGSRWHAMIQAEGIAVVGYAKHSSPMPPDEMKKLPNVFTNSVLEEAAFEIDVCSFCLWRLGSDPWQGGGEGFESLLKFFAEGPEAYVAFAKDYFEVDVSRRDVEAYYGLKELSFTDAQRLNDELTVEQFEEDVAEIGYPNR